MFFVILLTHCSFIVSIQYIRITELISIFLLNNFLLLRYIDRLIDITYKRQFGFSGTADNLEFLIILQEIFLRIVVAAFDVVRKFKCLCL